jgi:hypothetical protein
VFTDPIADPEATTPEAVRADYEETLAGIVEREGASTVVDAAGVSEDTLDALVAGESPDLTVEEAAGILAVSDDYPPAEDLLLEVQDHVMLQMSSAVMDVDALVSGRDDDMEP